MGIQLDGFEDVADGGKYAGSLLNDGFKRPTQLPSTTGEEAGGMDVAVNGSVILKAETMGELFGAFPAEEGFVNGGAVWMTANIALNAMVGGAGVFAVGASTTSVVGHV
jgi:hypothetical protein